MTWGVDVGAEETAEESIPQAGLSERFVTASLVHWYFILFLSLLFV